MPISLGMHISNSFILQDIPSWICNFFFKNRDIIDTKVARSS